ncbi:MAG: hypothetical protein AAGF85_08100 [Bacteroidota bacterium]
MRWNFGIWSITKAVLSLIVVFLLVLATHKLDKSHFSIVQESFASVYNDRLSAKDHIYKISRLLDLEKVNLYKSSEVPNYSLQDSINALVSEYSKTQLTTQEEQKFKQLKEKLDQLYVTKAEEGENTVYGEAANSQVMNKIIDVLNELDGLAAIQMLEAKREMDKSNRIIESSNMISGFEIGAFALIGVIVFLMFVVKPLE